MGPARLSVELVLVDKATGLPATTVARARTAAMVMNFIMALESNPVAQRTKTVDNCEC